MPPRISVTLTLRGSHLNQKLVFSSGARSRSVVTDDRRVPEVVGGHVGCQSHESFEVGRGLLDPFAVQGQSCGEKPVCAQVLHVLRIVRVYTGFGYLVIATKPIVPVVHVLVYSQHRDGKKSRTDTWEIKMSIRSSEESKQLAILN